jgi:DNA-binding transcriptional ArsR family regulator
MRVELDKAALFALASDTRLDILRALQPMRRTVTQLAESVGIDKAAVYRHLQKLRQGGLVKRYEDHGFVYYGLSWKARDLLAPNENTRIVILLTASLFSVAGAVAAATLAFAALLFGGSEVAGRGELLGDAGTPLPDPFVGNLLWVVPAVALAVVAAASLALAWRSLRKPKQPAPAG